MVQRRNCSEAEAKLHSSPPVEGGRGQASAQAAMHVRCMSPALTYGAVFCHEKSNSSVILPQTRSAKREQRYKSTVKSQECNTARVTPSTLSMTEFSTRTDLPPPPNRVRNQAPQYPIKCQKQKETRGRNSADG